MDKGQDSPVSASSDKNRPLTQSTDEFEQQEKNDQNLPIELTNVTGTQILDMNEDCLLELCSVNTLDLLDLCSLAETCRQFRQITQRVAKTIKIHCIESERYEIGCKYNQITTGNDDVERIFTHFGSTLSEVLISSVNRGNVEYYTGDLVARHCEEADDLKSLTMYWVEVPEVTVNLKPIFTRLQKLDLSHVTRIADASIFAGLNSLVELSINDVENCRLILENIFPKLERFTYRKATVVIVIGHNPFYELTLESLTTFILRHKTLKLLQLIFETTDDCMAVILQVIGNNCNELEQLALCISVPLEELGRCINAPDKMRPISLQQIQTLKSLRILTLKWIAFKDFKLFTALTELRELSLKCCNLPKDPSQFAYLVQLTKLSILWCEFSYVVGIISRLVCLKELEIMNPKFVLDEETLSKIVDVVKGRLNVLTMKCEFDFEEHCNENGKIKLVRSSRHYWESGSLF